MSRGKSVALRAKAAVNSEEGEEEDGQSRGVDGAGASGRNPARGFHEAAGLVGEQAGAGAARAGDPDWGDRTRAAADHGRDGAATGAILQDKRGVLTEPAEYLRFASDETVEQGCRNVTACAT